MLNLSLLPRPISHQNRCRHVRSREPEINQDSFDRLWSVSDAYHQRLVRNQPVKVAYRTIGTLLPKLYSCHQNLDYVIHLGVHPNLGHGEFLIERLARRNGYKSEDVDGVIGDEVLEEPEWSEWSNGPKLIHTTINVDEVIKHAKKHIEEPTNIRPSQDAGHYLCEFVYYRSLLHFHSEEGKRDGVNLKRSPALERPVIFLHVPPLLSEPAIQLARKVLKSILKSMAHTYSSQSTP